MKVWGAIAAGLVRRGGAVLISIRAALGSSPRDAGTRMVVFGDGTFTGTIGGGRLEWHAIAEAQRLLSARKSASVPSSQVLSPANTTPVSSPAGSPQPSSPASSPLLSSPASEAREGDPIQVASDTAHRKDAKSSAFEVPLGPLPSPFGLAGDDKFEDANETHALVTSFTVRSYALGPELGQCCGGRVTLSFEVIRSEAADSVRLLADREAGGPFVMTAHLDGDQLVRRVVATDAETAGGRLETFGDTARTLVLFGAGHVGRALVLAMSALPFRIIWVDARPDAFPAAVPANVTLVRPADPVAVLASAAAGSFVLIMTHSHELDLAICDAALRSPKFPYVGLIGSATKRARFERRLVEAGVERKAVDQLVCPIGTPGPKSKLPAVIAAATAVELLVKDEMCLNVGAGMNADQTLATTGVAGGRAMARGRSSGS